MREFIVKWRMALWFLALLVIFCGLFVVASPFLRRGEWHVSMGGQNDSYWVSREAKIDLYAPQDILAIISFDAQSHENKRLLQVLINGRKLSGHQIEGDRKKVILLSPLVQGVNVIALHSPEGCDFAWDGGNLKCYSFRIFDFTVQEAKNFSIDADLVSEVVKTTPLIQYGAGWHGPSTDGKKVLRWMDARAYVSMIGASAAARGKFMAVRLFSFRKPRTLEVNFGGRVIFKGEIPASRIGIRFGLPADIRHNAVVFESKDGCERVPHVAGSADSRCLSFGVERISIER
ncbi:MAG: hypothetical protein HY401_07555 [Elusimicrobia bacterium]|nr:hypothetical protein [Elusimicrobiota bacterium]